MKSSHLLITALLLTFGWTNSFAQVDIDKPVQMVGSGTDAEVKGVKSVSDTLDVPSLGMIRKNTFLLGNATGPANQYAVSLSPPVGSYSPGLMIMLMVNSDNTGPSTLNVNGLGDRPIKKNFNVDLAAADIVAGQIVNLVYDGSNFQMVSHVGPSGAGGPCTAVTTAGTISGPAFVAPGIGGYVYSVPAIANATDYHWDLPYGGMITAGFNTNSITVTFKDDACPGDVYVYGYNGCSNGPMSSPVAIDTAAPVIVFISTNTYPSDANVSTRDAACQNDASNAGLSGTFKAWVSTGGANNIQPTVNRPYFLADNGTLVAVDWTDLTDGALLAPINIESDGVSIFNGPVWTGLNAGGVATGYDCTDWTDGNGTGTLGLSSATDTTWTTDTLIASCGNFVEVISGYVFDGCSCSLYGAGYYPCGVEPGVTIQTGWDASPLCNLNTNNHNNWGRCCTAAGVAIDYRHYCFEQ